MKIYRFFSLVAAFFLVPLSLSAYQSDEVDETVQLETASFFKAITESDTVFIGEYQQGGKTKGRVKLIKAIFGTVAEEEIVKDIDKEKIRRKFKSTPFQSGSQYVFFVKKADQEVAAHPDGVTIQLVNKKANFSFAAPYSTNFWQPFDQKILETGIKAIKENSTGAITEETLNQINTLFSEYSKNSDIASVKALISIAYYLGIKLDEPLYQKTVEDTKTLGCLAAKFSAKIMGKSFFNDKILSKIKTANPDQQIATIFAAIDSDSKNAVAIFSQMLQQAEYYEPPTSECFPEPEPLSNKTMLARAIIEINAPESLKIIGKELRTEDNAWLTKLIKLLAQYEGDDLVELTLDAALQEKFSERKLEFANYFDRVRTPETEKSLKRIFEKTKEPVGRKFILAILGKYKYPESLPFLIKTINEDTNEEVRTGAAIAIGRLDNKDGIKPLFDFVMREKSILAKTIGIDAMSEIKDKSVQDYLKEIIKLSDNQKVKEEAVNAIEENLFILRYGHKKD